MGTPSFFYIPKHIITSKSIATMDDGVGFDQIGLVTTEKEIEKKNEEEEAFKAMLAKKKKKKKKKKKIKIRKTLANGDSPATQTKKSLESSYWDRSDDREYPYTVLLDRIFRKLTENNPTLISKESHSLPPPQTALHGSKKTGWGNFKKICDELNRKPEHVKLFFLTEMNTTGNMDGSNSFIIKGRWRPKQIESLLKKYIKEYVTCNNCRSPQTVMEKDNAMRLHVLTCKVCGASRSVTRIKEGFHAVTRAERRAARFAK